MPDLPIPPGTPGMPPASAAAPIGARPEGAPVESGMMTPQAPKGDQAHAQVNINMAVQILENSLPAFGASSPEGQAILNSLKTLTKQFGGSGGKPKELVPAEIMALMSALPQGGGGAKPPMPPMGGGMPPVPPGAM